MLLNYSALRGFMVGDQAKENCHFLLVDLQAWIISVTILLSCWVKSDVQVNSGGSVGNIFLH